MSKFRTSRGILPSTLISGFSGEFGDTEIRMHRAPSWYLAIPHRREMRYYYMRHPFSKSACIFKLCDNHWQNFTDAKRLEWKDALKVTKCSAYNAFMGECMYEMSRGFSYPIAPSVAGGWTHHGAPTGSEVPEVWCGKCPPKNAYSEPGINFAGTPHCTPKTVFAWPYQMPPEWVYPATHFSLLQREDAPDNWERTFADGYTLTFGRAPGTTFTTNLTFRYGSTFFAQWEHLWNCYHTPWPKADQLLYNWIIRTPPFTPEIRRSFWLITTYEAPL